MKRLAQYLYHTIDGRHTIIATIGFMVFTATVLPWISNLSTELIGVSESIDTSFHFNINHIYSIVDSYGPEGRNIYIILRWTFDVVWPLVYTSFLVTIIVYLAKKSYSKVEEKLLFIPILAMSFDFFENILATIVMWIYPTKINLAVYLLMGASILKWTILGLGFVVPVVLLIKLLIKRLL